MNRERAQELLEAARLSQSQFWEDLYELEQELGVEVDGTSDLEMTDIDGLLEDEDEI